VENTILNSTGKIGRHDLHKRGRQQMQKPGELLLEDDQMCFACGKKNPIGLKLKFTSGENDTLCTEFTPEKVHQGYKDVVHGGIIALVLDEVMVNLLWKRGRPAVSSRLAVKLLQPAKPGETLFFRARIVKDGKRVVETEAEAVKGDHSLVASATAKCVEVKASKH